MRFGSAFFVPALIGLVCTSGQLCAAEKFKLLGTWEIEASSLTMPNAPQHVTITFSDVGANQYNRSVIRGSERLMLSWMTDRALCSELARSRTKRTTMGN